MSGISEVFITVISGTLVYVLGRFFTKLLIKPVHELNQCIGKVNDKLIYYANKYCNPKPENKEEVANCLRKLSSEIRAKSNVVKAYALFSSLRFIPSRKGIDKAAEELIFLSNSIHDGNGRENSEKANEIKSIKT
jgi:hypothetical protein